MRMWHYKLIPFLPQAQLFGQWRECCAIAQEWAETGGIKHPLVRPVIFGSYIEFTSYCETVKDEMTVRGYPPQDYTIVKLKDRLYKIATFEGEDITARKIIEDIWNRRLKPVDIYFNWHNQTYLEICWWNLYEKFLCGCVPPVEWARFEEGGKELV